MAAWDNQAPIPAPNYNQGQVDWSQLSNLLQQKQPQQQQQKPLPGPYQTPGQPMDIQPQLPLARRLASFLTDPNTGRDLANNLLSYSGNPNAGYGPGGMSLAPQPPSINPAVRGLY